MKSAWIIPTIFLTLGLFGLPVQAHEKIHPKSSSPFWPDFLNAKTDTVKEQSSNQQPANNESLEPISNLDTTEQLKSDTPSWVKEVDVNGALFYRNLEDETIFNDSALGLIEADYAGDTYEVQAGLVYENSLESSLKINSLSFKSYHDNAVRNQHYDFQLGKFVTKVGVLDYLSLLNTYNIPRVQYYDETNPNLRFVPAWMGKLDIYPDTDSTVSLHLQPFDPEYVALWGRGQQFGLNAVVPYLLTNTGNEDLDLIGNAILVPVYENGAKTALNRYIDSKVQEIDSDMYNSTMGVSYLINQQHNTYGVSFVNGVSKAPLIKIDPNLIAAVGLLVGEDKQAYLDDFVLQADNAPIKSIDYFRYNQAGLFYETTLAQLGLRAEITHQDKFPLLNELSNLTTLGVGIDHKGMVYNNLELQYFNFNERNLAAYYAVWALKLDPFNLGGSWKLHLKNTLAYGKFDNTDIATTLPSVTFSYDTLDIALEYLAHSRQEFTPDTATVAVKLRF
ncbi:hypothetical protein [Thiomicrorhabdus aquaedulcis]|uniref:hypothetical protein n=1 Tax=Thiomicrorhabdus aquaedulcis TaxID=2211106 RepID=UPI000FDA488D|nr:hypothetical protein [Thiomicrorhabdus aquaedulcis]